MIWLIHIQRKYAAKTCHISEAQIPSRKKLFVSICFPMVFGTEKMYENFLGVLPKYKTVVFVNGCFWHMHDCGRFVWPSSNKEYWSKKINRNVERDAENHRILSEQGWKVLVIWECQLKKKVADENLKNLYTAITQ